MNYDLIEETTMSSFSFLDALAQILSISVIILFAVFIVWVLRSIKERGRQLDRIERKLDDSLK